MRLAVMHPFWGHPSETIAKSETSDPDRSHRGSKTSRRPDAAAIGGKAQTIQFINSFVWKLEADERQVNVLEFIEIARVLGVKASKLMLDIEA
jgi:hypothetical protein